MVTPAAWLLLLLLASAPQDPPPSSPAQVRAALAEGRDDEAWALVERLPADALSLAVAVETATRVPVADIPEARRAVLARLAARVTITDSPPAFRNQACAVLLRVAADAECASVIDAAIRQGQAPPDEQVRLWVLLARLGLSPAPLPAGWEAAHTGSSALEIAGWAEVPAASRVRLLTPLVSHQDMATQVAALMTLQEVPGPEALAMWRTLAANPPGYPGARTLITVGLARHGDPVSLQTLMPHEAQLSARDRVMLNIGRAERGGAPARQALVNLLASGSELEAVLAAEALASLTPTPAEAALLRRHVVAASPALRWRIMAVAARFGLGRTPEVVRRLADIDPVIRLEAAVAVAAVAPRPERTRP